MDLNEARRQMALAAQELERGTILTKQLLDHMEAVDDRAEDKEQVQDKTDQAMRLMFDHDEEEAEEAALRILQAGTENVHAFRVLRDALDAALGGLQDMTHESGRRLF
jgi:hypothetical protein